MKKEFKIMTEDGREIKRFDSELGAYNYWESVCGVWIDYDDNDKEYLIYVEEVE